jgi:hypothetical protein
MGSRRLDGVTEVTEAMIESGAAAERLAAFGAL